MNPNFIFLLIFAFICGTIVGYMQKKMIIVLLKEEIDLLNKKINSSERV